MSIDLSKQLRKNPSGHVLIYKPEHPSSYKTGNWKGYVYEHRYIAEIKLGRELRPEEEVHHLDDNPSNNEWQNLLVLDKVMHGKLHAWIAKSAPKREILRQNGVNSEKPNLERRCLFCGISLPRNTTKYCSATCNFQRDRGSKRPPKEELIECLKTMSFCAVGRKYGVSDNAVRKWLRYYERPSKATLSQAEGTPSEGATTTGEVKPS